MTPVRIGVLGLGTVGGGTVNVLRRNGKEITRRAGRDIVVTRAAARSLDKERFCSTEGISLTTDPDEIVRGPGHRGRRRAHRRYRPRSPARPRGHRARQARGHRKQGAHRGARQRDLRGRTCARGDGGVRSRGGGRDPDHQGVARRARREPDRVARRDHQRHEQLHPDRDARTRRRVCRRPRRGAAARLRGGGSHVRHRGDRRRAQAHDPRCDRVRHAARLRAGIYRGHHPGDAGRRRLRRAARLPNQASRDRPAHRGRGGDAGAPDPGPRSGSSSRTSMES